jgi:hypothetical protein
VAKDSRVTLAGALRGREDLDGERRAAESCED